MNEPIQKYARMLNARDKLLAAGQIVPAKLANEIYKSEATAQRVFNPDQLRMVGQQVEHLRAGYISDEVELKSAQDFQVNRARENKAFDKATSGLAADGRSMTPNQLAQAIENNGKFIRKAPRQFDDLKHERHCQKVFGISLDEFMDRHEQLESAELKDPRVAKILRDKWKITPNMQQDFKANGLQKMWERKDAKDNPQKDTEVNLGANEIKADLMAAMSSEEHRLEVYDEPISGKLLREDSLTGDIANAFHQHEEKEIHEAAGIDYEIDVDEESGEIRGYANG